MSAHPQHGPKVIRILQAIAIVRSKVSSIPSITEADEMAVLAAEKRVKAELQRELGARFWFGSDGKFHLQMANVGASNAESGASLLRRWQIDAGRKIQMMKAVAA